MLIPKTKMLYLGWRMKDGHCNIRWFDGDAVPKIADVVPQCKSKLIKISKILKQIATNFNLLFNF